MSVADQQPNTLPEVWVSFVAGITDKTVDVFAATAAEAINKRVEKINLLLSSGGGNVHPGWTLFGLLRSYPFHLVMYNVGSVDSIALAPFLASDERYCAPHATFLFHGITWTPYGGAFVESALAEQLSSIRANQDRYAALIAERTALSVETVRNYFREGTTLTAKQALEAGIVRGIQDPKIPTTAAVVHLRDPSP